MDVSRRQLGLLSLVERRGSGQRQKVLASLQNRYSEARGMEREEERAWDEALLNPNNLMLR